MIDRQLGRRAFLTAAAAAAVAGPALTGPALAAAEPLADRGYALGDMVLGAPDAPVTVIEYASLTCPHCATFHTQALPTIKRDYVDTGKVRFVFREVYFDQYGLWASMIARCGGEASFFPQIETLMERMNDWARADNIVGELQRIGRLGGLSAERMQACLTDEDLMNRLVGDFRDNASADGVRSTPTFIINGETHTGAMSAAQFAALLDRHL